METGDGIGIEVGTGTERVIEAEVGTEIEGHLEEIGPNLPMSLCGSGSQGGRCARTVFHFKPLTAPCFFVAVSLPSPLYTFPVSNYVAHSNVTPLFGIASRPRARGVTSSNFDKPPVLGANMLPEPVPAKPSVITEIIDQLKAKVS